MHKDSTLPAELAALDRWVVWALVPNNESGEPVKCPFQVTGREASSTNPTTWTTYSRAIAAADQLGMEGVGIVLGGGLVGIDLDHAVHDGVIDPWAMDIIERIDSYTEMSPSGTGVHILAFGTLPPGRRRRDFIEVYDSGRYFTFTGEALPGYEAVEERTEALAEWHAETFPPEANNANTAPPRPVDMDDRTLLDKAMRDPKFARLWNGDMGEYKNDANRADLALCDKLAFWTGREPERMDRLFRHSRLMRPKWDEFRGERTYGAITIAKAIEGTTETYSPGARAEYSDWSRRNGAGGTQGDTEEPAEDAPPRARFRILRRDEFLSLPEPEWLVDGVIPRPGTGLIYSPSGLGKSFERLHLACCVATGTAWFGRDVVQGDVLYIACEGQAGFKKRLQAWESYYDVEAERLYWMADAPQFMHPDDVEAVLAELAASGVQPALVIIDTLARTLVGGDENSARDVGQYLASMERLRAETRAHISVVHHTGHNTQDRPRGSSTIMPAVDTLIALQGDPENHELQLVCEKQKDAAEFEPISLHLIAHHGSLVAVASESGTAGTSAADQAVLQVLIDAGEEGLSTTQWKAALPGMAPRSFHRTKSRLQGFGLVKNVGTHQRTRWISCSYASAKPPSGTTSEKHPEEEAKSGSVPHSANSKQGSFESDSASVPSECQEEVALPDIDSASVPNPLGLALLALQSQLAPSAPPGENPKAHPCETCGEPTVGPAVCESCYAKAMADWRERKARR